MREEKSSPFEPVCANDYSLKETQYFFINRLAFDYEQKTNQY
jgi:hypothetical protein